MIETDTQTARSSSRDAHSHRLRRVFSWFLPMDNQCPSSPLTGEDRGEGEAIMRLTQNPLTLTLSPVLFSWGRGNSRYKQTNEASAHV